MNKRYKEGNGRIIYFWVSVLIILIVALIITISIYVNNKKQKDYEIAMKKEDNNVIQNTATASSGISKSVNEVMNEDINSITQNTVIEKVQEAKTVEEVAKIEKTIVKENNEEIKEEVEVEFVKPVDGEIIKSYARENLIYSQTLQEWTTHNGIDIKADETTVVKSAEKGIVKSIKNDPRYGLSIIIEHEGGYQTVYSNLLSTEFVVEGENLEKEQPIGTVGKTASFEILDEAHLHFEILKDGLYQDPMIYIN